MLPWLTIFQASFEDWFSREPVPDPYESMWDKLCNYLWGVRPVAILGLPGFAVGVAYANHYDASRILCGGTGGAISFVVLTLMFGWLDRRKQNEAKE